MEGPGQDQSQIQTSGDNGMTQEQESTEMLESKEQRNLIVNYLPPSLTEDGLRAIFQTYGEILSCKLMIDKHTCQSLGYGFIEFKDIQSATNAIEGVNGKQIESKRLKVSYARPSSSAIQHANLYISHLDPHVTKPMLDKMFSPFGAIIDSKILVDPKTGVSRGVGFVRYDTKAQAQAAINALNGVQLPQMSQPIYVKFADSMDEKMKRKRNKAFGSNQMLYKMNQYSMGGRYSPYGVLTSGGMYDSLAMQSGLGVYGYPAQPAVQQQQQQQQQQQYCLFVYNLPPNTDENLLYRLFSPYGALVNVKIIRDLATGNCKGYGFVNYLKLEEAQQAILNLNGFQMGNKFLQVSFKTQGKVGMS
jgi:RNA recognition motif-containing protein